MEIMGIKNHRKPINLSIRPEKEVILIIQQVGCKMYSLVGGEGACFIKNNRPAATDEKMLIYQDDF